jgi:hypothetical protein
MCETSAKRSKRLYCDAKNLYESINDHWGVSFGLQMMNGYLSEAAVANVGGTTTTIKFYKDEREGLGLLRI